MTEHLAHGDDAFVNFKNGTRQWVFIKRGPGDDPGRHGPYWRDRITPRSFMPTTPVAEAARLRAWAREHAEPEQDLRSVLERELFEPLRRASAVYRLRDLGQPARHDWGFVLGPFYGLVLIDHERAQLALVVASDD